MGITTRKYRLKSDITGLQLPSEVDTVPPSCRRTSLLRMNHAREMLPVLSSRHEEHERPSVLYTTSVDHGLASFPSMMVCGYCPVQLETVGRARLRSAINALTKSQISLLYHYHEAMPVSTQNNAIPRRPACNSEPQYL